MTHRKPIRSPTTDRAPPDAPDILTTEQLGPNMSRTPNGNLLCKNVPIARVGWMVYLPGEVPIDAKDRDHVRVYRGPDELFSPATIGSFIGAAVTDEHPEEDVTPKNWKKLAFGFVLSAWRGDGEDEDVLLADLLITDDDLIEAIEGKKREVSCGYDADYIETGEAEGRQANIIGNHVALVERGRCGPRCAIGDHDPTTKGNDMGTRVKIQDAAAKRREAVRKLFKDAEALLEETADPDAVDTDTDTGGTHIHIHTNGSSGQGDPDAGGSPGGMPNTVSHDEGPDGGGGDPTEERFARIEQSIEQLSGTVAQLAEALGARGGQGNDADPDEMDGEADPDGEGEPDPTKDEAPDEEEEEGKRASTGDSAALANTYATLLADIEVLVPGFRVPTFDAKAKRKNTVDAMCGLRRKALDACYATAQGKTLIDSVSGSKSLNLDKMDCQAVATVFRASAGAQRLLNNNKATRDASGVPNPVQPNGGNKVTSLAAMNQAMRDYWAKQGVNS